MEAAPAKKPRSPLSSLGPPRSPRSRSPRRSPLQAGGRRVTASSKMIKQGGAGRWQGPAGQHARARQPGACPLTGACRACRAGPHRGRACRARRRRRRRRRRPASAAGQAHAPGCVGHAAASSCGRRTPGRWLGGCLHTSALHTQALQSHRPYVAAGCAVGRGGVTWMRSCCMMEARSSRARVLRR